jgi:hypothetical protein
LFENLIDDPSMNRRVIHSDQQGKFLKKVTNRVSLHEKLYNAFVPLHDFFKCADDTYLKEHMNDIFITFN